MVEKRFCKKHGETDFVLDNTGRWRCKKCRSESTQKRRDKVKLLSIEYKGGKCEICGYNKCPDALEFHHIDSTQKDFGIGEKGYTKSFESIKTELDKCMLLCCRCHREIHYKLREKYKTTELILNEINKNTKSVIKENSKDNKRNISKDEIIESFVRNGNFLKVGRDFNMSDNAVRKWCKKYELPTHTKDMIEYLRKIGRLP